MGKGNQNSENVTSVIEEISARLSSPADFVSFKKKGRGSNPLPSIDILEEIVKILRNALFPGYFAAFPATDRLFYHQLTLDLERVFTLLKEQIRCGFCFSCESANIPCGSCEKWAHECTLQFIKELPTIRRLLASDVKAAFEGDPAATSPDETIFCYPSIIAMTHHRIAHVLHRFDVPFVPRVIAEMAHAKTGIEIHPGASIGEEFFVDHGTGVVIGGTSIIGNKCRLYQGVTLGALSFQKDESGKLVKGLPRHPILGNNITVYAGATILGRIHIGDNSIIGGNVWLTESVPENSRIVQQKNRSPLKEDNIVGNCDTSK